MTDWLCLGTSVSARRGLEKCKQIHVDGVITCNSGFRLLRPTVYFLCDQVACKLYGADVKAAKLPRCVTLYRGEKALTDRGLTHFHEFYRNGTPWEPFQNSGLWCLEWCCRIAEADRVHLVGMDGYRGGGRDYFDGAPDSKNTQDSNERILGPLTTTIVRKYPRTEFILYGECQYPMPDDLPNWRIAGEERQAVYDDYGRRWEF